MVATRRARMVVTNPAVFGAQRRFMQARPAADERSEADDVSAHD